MKKPLIILLTCGTLIGAEPKAKEKLEPLHWRGLRDMFVIETNGKVTYTEGVSPDEALKSVLVTAQELQLRLNECEDKTKKGSSKKPNP